METLRNAKFLASRIDGAMSRLHNLGGWSGLQCVSAPQMHSLPLPLECRWAWEKWGADYCWERKGMEGDFEDPISNSE